MFYRIRRWQKMNEQKIDQQKTNQTKANEQKQKAAIAFVKKHDTFGTKRFKYHFDDRIKNPKKLKLGFLSADFRHHPTGYVISEFFELIDRDKVDLYLYDTLPCPDTKASQRIYTTTPNIRVVDKKTDEEIADTIFADKIDVLIDLNGLTTRTRSGVMTYHPAFVQGTFLGCIGTCGGVPGIDYHFVDRYSILPGEEKYYCEKLKYLEPTRWVIDHKMAKASTIHSKSFYGFNVNYKIYGCSFLGSIWCKQTDNSGEFYLCRFVGSSALPTGEHAVNYCKNSCVFFVDSNSYNERSFYKKIVETQMFNDFIFKKMIPKDINDRLEILFFDEHINKKNNKKLFTKNKPILYLNSKEYEYENTYSIPLINGLHSREKKRFIDKNYQ